MEDWRWTTAISIGFCASHGHTNNHLKRELSGVSLLESAAMDHFVRTFVVPIDASFWFGAVLET